MKCGPVLIVATALLVGAASAVFSRRTTTTLATFNAGLIPSFRGLDGNSVIEERASLLIEEVREF